MCIASGSVRIVNNDLEKMFKETVVGMLEVLSQHMLVGAEEIHGKHQL
jgi:hypothetical protein